MLSRRSFLAAVASALVAARAPRIAAGDGAGAVLPPGWWDDDPPFMFAVGDRITFGEPLREYGLTVREYRVTAVTRSHVQFEPCDPGEPAWFKTPPEYLRHAR